MRCFQNLRRLRWPKLATHYFSEQHLVHSHYIQNVNRKEIMSTYWIRGVCSVRVVVVVNLKTIMRVWKPWSLSMTDNRNTYPSKTVMRKVVWMNSVIRSSEHFDIVCQEPHQQYKAEQQGQKRNVEGKNNKFTFLCYQYILWWCWSFKLVLVFMRGHVCCPISRCTLIKD